MVAVLFQLAHDGFRINALTAVVVRQGSSSRARLEVGTDGVHTVLPPVDAARDDSTALAALPQETLARLLLPLGEFDAGDLAELAQELQL